MSNEKSVSLTEKELSTLRATEDFSVDKEYTVVKVGDNIFGLDTLTAVVKVEALDKTMKTVKVAEDGSIEVSTIHAVKPANKNERTSSVSEYAGAEY